MKYPIACALLLTGSAALAQVASHAPTISGQVPASTQNMVALTSSGKPVARVNGAVLTDVDLVREEYSIFPYARQHNGLPRDLAPQIREGALKMIIFEELVYQEALHRKLAVSPARMLKAKTDFRKQFASPDEYNAFLKSDFQGSQKLLDEKIRRSLLIEVLLNAEVERKAVVTPADLKAYYDQNIARFTHPEAYRFQTITVLPPPNATADQLKEVRKRADSALKQARATKTAQDFGLLAEKISEDDYRVMMGQHKPVPVDQMPPQVVASLRKMQPNDVSGLIQVDQAYTILRLQEHLPAGKAKFEEVKKDLDNELHEKKRNELRKQLDQKLRQTAKVEEL